MFADVVHRETMFKVAIVFLVVLMFANFVMANWAVVAKEIIRIIGILFTIETAINKLQDAIADLRGDIDSLESSHDNAVRRWNTAFDAWNDYKMDLPGLEDAAENAEDYYSDLRQDRTELEQEIRDAISPSEVDRLRSELRMLNGDILDADIARTNAAGAVRRQRLRINNAKKRMDDADRRIKDLDRRLKRLRQDKQRKEDELQRQRDRYNDYMNQKSDAEDRYYALTGQHYGG